MSSAAGSRVYLHKISEGRAPLGSIFISVLAEPLSGDSKNPCSNLQREAEKLGANAVYEVKIEQETWSPKSLLVCKGIAVKVKSEYLRQ